MPKSYSHCPRCDMAFSFTSSCVCPKCGTGILNTGQQVHRDFIIGNREYRASYSYENDGFPEDYAGHVLNQGMICLMALTDGSLVIKEKFKEKDNE